MKRLFASALVILMILLCAGCGETTTDTSSLTSSANPSSTESQMVVSNIYPQKNEYKEWTYAVTDVAERLTLGNRCPISESAKGIVFDQAGANFSFKADCEGDVKLAIKGGTSWEYRFHYYTVYVDGVRQERLEFEFNPVRPEPTVITVAKNLPRGIHEIKVVRANPAEKGEETVKSIILKGVLCEDKPKEQELLIEFLGDSLTAGLGNLDFENGSFDSKYSDSTQTYAYFTAEAFGADFSSVCCGGLPFTAEYGGMSLKDRYNRVSFKRDAGQHDFARPADIVVINLGTNDHGRLNGGELNGRQFTDAAKDLMQFVRKKNPNAKIVWAYGMAYDGAKDYLSTAVKELGGDDEGYYFCHMPGNIAGEKGHPVVESHQNAAKTLINFMKDKLGLKEAK